ncbi:MAG: adenosylcobinamide-GDP ribazoletransferase [Methylocystis sp.]|nr:adenosylcobinamide-GDP ribazoletransferase [Methylocystis sp.]
MFARFADDLDACLRFYSRLPARAGRNGHAMPDFRTAVRALPVAGTILGACGGGALLLARLAGVPALPAAACAIAALVAVTGALHEDGLADVIDGFGGGATQEEKLEIMRDSRLGSYGAAALALSLILRVTALAAIAERGTLLGVAALIVAGAVSRTAGLAPIMISAPARADGAGHAALRPLGQALRTAIILAAALSLLPLAAGASLGQIMLADAGALSAAYLVAKLAERQIGGLTGDVLGAAQQGAEIVVLLVLATTP